jgi:hypothetical protein
LPIFPVVIPCGAVSSCRAGNRDIDMETNILSHEHIEMVTDPMLNAWFASDGQEIGDLCAYNYGTRDEDGGVANQNWNGHFYL